MAEFTEEQLALQAEIQKRRHYTIDQSGKTDTYIRAWMMIKNGAEQGVSRFTMKSHKKSLDVYMKDLDLYAYQEASEAEQEVYRAEWSDFAKRVISLSYEDRTYGSTLWGLIPMKKETVGAKIARDIQLAMHDYPAEFQLENYFAPLQQILVRELEIQRPNYENQD